MLNSLQTKDPSEGLDLAVKLSRIAVRKTQPDDKIRQELREKYAADAGSLIEIAGVVATNFQTIALANGFWKSEA